MESSSEVRIEDVVNDRIEHGSAVLEPLECGDHGRRDVRLARRAGTVDDVDGKEGEVEDDEDGEQVPEDSNRPTTSIRLLHDRAPPEPRAYGAVDSTPAGASVSLELEHLHSLATHVGQAPAADAGDGERGVGGGGGGGGRTVGVRVEVGEGEGLLRLTGVGSRRRTSLVLVRGGAGRFGGCTELVELMKLVVVVLKG